MTTEKVAPFLIEVTPWVAAQSDILALALVGSHTLNAAAEMSDVDQVLITLDSR